MCVAVSTTGGMSEAFFEKSTNRGKLTVASRTETGKHGFLINGFA
jgi:hypothetical protein